MIVGLTGGIGSGKSSVARFFRALGVQVIDADEISRHLLTPESSAFAKVMEHFGPSILQKEGGLNRSLLRTLIFEDPSERAWLENLLHPMIKEEIQSRATAASMDHTSSGNHSRVGNHSSTGNHTNPGNHISSGNHASSVNHTHSDLTGSPSPAPINRNYTVVDIPLLIEANFQDIVHRILVVDCPQSLQIERVMKREGMSKEEVEAILANQASRSTRLENANEVIENIDTLETLKSKVQTLHNYYTELSTKY